MSEYKKRSQNSYDAKADNYENTFDGKFTEPFKQELIKNIEINEAERILDVACGTGELLGRLAKKNSFQGYGIDISENMIKVARQRFPLMSFKAGDCENMSFEAGFFNKITICAAFHHFPAPEKFLAEAARIMKAGGSIYIAEVYLPPVIRQVCNLFMPLSKAGDVKMYSPEEIMQMYANAGFTEYKHCRKGHVQIVSAKKI